jgi:hypothetical protein
VPQPRAPHSATGLHRTRIDADVRFFPAFDLERAQWIEDGWRRATEDARRWLEEYESSAPGLERDALWEHALDTAPGFWDPPRAAIGFACSLFGARGDGRLRDRGRAALRQLLWESSYSVFLAGRSTSDFVLAALPPGAVAGPFATPYGPCVVRLLERRVAALPRDDGDRPLPEHIEAERARRRFAEYAHAALAAAEIVGLPAADPAPRIILP